MLAWSLALLAVLSGALVSYSYDEDAPTHARLCNGACTGFAALGLFGFVCASLFGMTGATLALVFAFAAAPLLLLARTDWRARVRFDLDAGAQRVRQALVSPSWRATLPVVAYVAAALLFWCVFGRALFERAGELYTGVDNNLGDLPFHLGIVTSFVHGANFPPLHPEYAGARLTYPFVVDFVAALLVRAGATLEAALFWENFALALALVGLLHRFALKLTGDWLAALFAPLLTLFSGGCGWWLLFSQPRAGDGSLLSLLQHLPHDYTITFDGLYRWGNAITTLLVPQRGLLLGLPLAIVVLMQVWQAVAEAPAERSETQLGEGRKGKGEKDKQAKGARRMGAKQAAETAALNLSPLNLSPFPAAFSGLLGAGFVAGLLPLVHAHSFVVLMLMCGCLAWLFPQRWRMWVAFFVVTFVIAAPQMWWATRNSAAQAGSFFAWQFGWDHGTHNPFWFWLNNMGLFIPLLLAALLWRGDDPLVPRRLLRFYLPFTLCFVIANVAKISPWVWDNIKVIFYWYVASVPLVALLLARLWRRGGVGLRVVTVALVLLLTCAGGLDVWRVVSEASEQREFTGEGVAFAELIKARTAPEAVILSAPIYNHPVYLTGRRALLGYTGHLWSQGIDYAPREAEVRRIYAGAPDAAQLLAQHHVAYVVVSPLERAALTVNESFFSRYPIAGETGGYRLYQITQP